MDKQQINARFFGSHIGCKCTITGKEMFFELVGLDYDFGDIKAVCLHSDENGAEEHRVLLDECKLVLRPLSSITDAEAMNVLTKATGLHIVKIERDSDKIVGVGMGRGGGNVISGGGNVAMWLKISPLPVGRFLETWNSQGGEAPECMDYVAMDYLRSINICVPFCGLDPIAEGWAILEEKIPAKRTIPIKCTKAGCYSTGVVSSDDCEIPKTAVTAIETCPAHTSSGGMGSDLRFIDSNGEVVY